MEMPCPRGGEFLSELTVLTTPSGQEGREGERIIYGDDPCPRGGGFLSELTVLTTPSGQEGRADYFWRVSRSADSVLTTPQADRSEEGLVICFGQFPSLMARQRGR